LFPYLIKWPGPVPDGMQAITDGVRSLETVEQKKNDKRPVVLNCQTTNKRPTAKLQKIVRPLTTLVDNSDIPKPNMIDELMTEDTDVKKKEARERKTLKQRERRRCTKKRKRKAAWARAKYQKIKLNKAAIVQEAAKVKEATRSEVWPVLKMVKDVYCQLAVPSTMDIEITREVTNSITKLKLGDSGLNNETRDDDDTGEWPTLKMMEDVDGQQAVEISGEVTTNISKQKLSDSGQKNETRDDEDTLTGEDDEEEVIDCWDGNSVVLEEVKETESLAGEDDEEDVIDCWKGICEGQESDERKVEVARKETVENIKKKPMTEVEKQIIGKALYARGRQDDVIVSSGVDYVTRRCFATLRPGKLLNDEIISFYYRMLGDGDKEACEQDSCRRRSHLFNSFFITKLLNEGHYDPTVEGTYDYSKVKNWGEKVPGKDIFDLHRIFIPINVACCHWVCAVVFMQERRIVIYDSLRGEKPTGYLQAIFRYLLDEHQAKHGRPLPCASDWRLEQCGRETPGQTNSYDCGVFTCMFAEYITRDRQLDFTQSDITEYRKKLVLAIMTGKRIY
jgi:hypothetical protein